MKKLATLVFLFCLTTVLAQNKKVEIKEEINSKVEAKVTSISYSVDSAKELETIDWKDIKSIFETNKPEEIIKITFGIDDKKLKHNLKSSFTVSGETKDIDSLIIKAKKGIKAITTISKKYKKN